MSGEKQQNKGKSLLFWLLLPIVMVSVYAFCGFALIAALGLAMGVAVSFTDSAVQLIAVWIAIIVGSVALYLRIPKATRSEFWKDLKRP